MTKSDGGQQRVVPTVGVESAVTNGVGGGLPPPTSASSPMPGRDNDIMSSSGMDMDMIIVGAGVAAGASKMLWIGG